MDKILDFLSGNPMWLIAIILGVVCIFVSKFKKDNNEQNDDNKNTNNEKKNEAVLSDKTVVPVGYYRYQKDNQLVIERTAEQKRIFEEYFVVRNYKTTTCDTSIKKTVTIPKVPSIPKKVHTEIGSNSIRTGPMKAGGE